MKYLLGFALVMASLSAGAVDTTGCSPLQEQTKEKTTAHGGVIKVTSLKAPAASCWNVNESTLRVAYSWLQDDANTSLIHAAIWMQVNNRAVTVLASVSCTFATPGAYQVTRYVCTATAESRVGDIDTWNIEVAPVLNGVWDTAGYGQNYRFQL